MATKYFFDNKEVIIPGVYSTIKSGVKNPILSLAYGNTLVINTGSGKFFGGGAGINGTLKTGKDSHYTFDNVRDFRKFIRGGAWWLLSGPLFLPGGGATAGISSLTYIKAAQTVPAEITIPFGLPSGGVDDGSVVVQVADEGFGGNGVLGDETRAVSTVTVTAAGADGDTITISVGGIVIAEAVKVTADTIATMVAKLAASITEIGVCEVVSSNGTTVTFRAPSGSGVITLTPTVDVTGSAAASAVAFAGGVEGTKLTRGYAAKVIAGISDTAKFIVQFWRGTYKGTDASLLVSGTPAALDGIIELSTKPELVVQSPELATVSALVAWMQDIEGAGFTFSQFFKLKSYTIAATDTILAADKTTGYIKAVGGNESFSVSHLSDVLNSISDLTFDFILADQWGDNARSVENLAIQDWITNTSKGKPDMYIAVGDGISKWNSGSTSSNQVAIAYDSQDITVVHGGAKISSGRALKEYKAIYKAAALLGREAGIEPQNPLTFKNIGIQGEVHPLLQNDLKLGLTNGVLMTRADGTAFEVVKGINTLQNSTYLVNPDGTTHSKQLKRIARQINKEIVFNAKVSLFKKPNGANRNTVSAEDVKTWLEGFLGSKVATDKDDDLILSFSNVEVNVVGDAYEVTYAMTPNFEVSFIFVTGTVIDPTV